MIRTHYHWNEAGDGLRECSLADELAEPTFWAPDPPVQTPHEDVAWVGWVDLGWTDDE